MRWDNIHDAVGFLSVDDVARILNETPACVHEIDKSGMSVLHLLAVKNPRTDERKAEFNQIFNLLIPHNPNPLLLSNNGHTALNLAEHYNFYPLFVQRLRDYTQEYQAANQQSGTPDGAEPDNDALRTRHITARS